MGLPQQTGLGAINPAAPQAAMRAADVAATAPAAKKSKKKKPKKKSSWLGGLVNTVAKAADAVGVPGAGVVDKLIKD
jgi:hypothetical protein